MTEINEMTPEELRLAIAKAKGITPPGRDYPGLIDAAWELVEEAQLIVGPEYSGGRESVQIGWSVYDSWIDVSHDVWTMPGSERALAIAETAPLAICKAYLEWKKAQP